MVVSFNSSAFINNIFSYSCVDIESIATCHPQYRRERNIIRNLLFLSVTESNETNNVLVAAGTITVTNDVDLIVTVATPSVSTVAASQQLTVTNTVKNQGTSSPAVATYTGIYLSTDATVTTGDTYLGNAYSPAYLLTSGAEHTNATVVTVPAGLATGTYYLGVIADRYGSVTESNETNNVLVAAGTITVTNDVDLIVTVATPSVSTVAASQQLTVTNTVKNQGTSSPAVATYTGIYLSTDATVTTGDTYLGNAYSPAYLLTSGAEHTNATVVTVPAGLATGTYYLGVIADRYGSVTETDEGNNTLVAAGTLEVTNP